MGSEKRPENVFLTSREGSPDPGNPGPSDYKTEVDSVKF